MAPVIRPDTNRLGAVRFREELPQSPGTMPSRQPVRNLFPYLPPFSIFARPERRMGRLAPKGEIYMTLEEIKASPKIFLIPADIAPILQTDPHTIRCTARQRPDLLGFEFTFTGNRMKIPRIAFLRWLGEIA